MKLKGRLVPLDLKKSVNLFRCVVLTTGTFCPGAGTLVVVGNFTDFSVLLAPKPDKVISSSLVVIDVVNKSGTSVGRLLL